MPQPRPGPQGRCISRVPRVLAERSLWTLSEEQLEF